MCQTFDGYWVDSGKWNRLGSELLSGFGMVWETDDKQEKTRKNPHRVIVGDHDEYYEWNE